VKVLVTGAAGFLGRHVVDALVQRGHAVRALDLATALGAARWSSTAVEACEADLCGADLSDACRGVDAAVHLAAQLQGEAAAMVEAATVGTTRLVEAMAAAGARRLVLASSLSVYDWSAGQVLDEEAPLEPAPEARDGYTMAKLSQETVARERCAGTGIELTVLRPGILWGQGRELPSTLGQQLGPVHLVIAPGRSFPAVHVRNCADAFAAALDGVPGTFNVVDHPEVTPAQFVRDHLQRAGRRGLALPVPYRVGLACALVLYGASPGPLRRRLPSFLAPRRFAARYRPVRIDGARLRAAGWRPPFSHEACLELTYGGTR
jgi:nucleoside-diphosphate-sugar epimerase